MDQTVTSESKGSHFWDAIDAFEFGFAKVTQRFHYLPPKVGGYDWRIAMSDHVGKPLSNLGWNLPDLVREAEQRAYRYVKQGGKKLVSCSVASPNSIRRLKAALRKLRPVLSPAAPSETEASWLW